MLKSKNVMMMSNLIYDTKTASISRVKSLEQMRPCVCFIKLHTKCGVRSNMLFVVDKENAYDIITMSRWSLHSLPQRIKDRLKGGEVLEYAKNDMFQRVLTTYKMQLRYSAKLTKRLNDGEVFYFNTGQKRR